MNRYRHIVDGSIQFILPNDPVQRAEAFGRLAKAWSTMLSEVDDLVTEAREPTRLVGRVLVKSTQEAAAEAQYQPVSQPPSRIVVTPPSSPTNGAGKHHAKRKVRGPDKRPRKTSFKLGNGEHRVGYSVSEAAERLGGASKSTIYRLLATNALHAVKRGSNTLITAESIENYIQSLPAFSSKVSKHGDTNP